MELVAAIFQDAHLAISFAPILEPFPIIKQSNFEVINRIMVFQEANSFLA